MGNKAEKKKILFLYPNPTSFIEKDLALLEEEFHVVPLQYRGKKDIFKVFRRTISTDLNLSWFVLGYATSAALFSRMFGRKSVVIAGGWDVVSMPEIGYGAMTSEKRIKKTRYALKHARKIIAVSKSSRDWVSKWIDRDDIEVIYHGFDPQRFSPSGEKERMVVTVGRLTNEVTIKVKGLETFLKTAELLPDVKFTLIGDHDPKIEDEWRKRAPANLEIVGSITQDELISYYQRASVYAQLSFQESFGCALAEGMLCGCVPVVTGRGAIPEVVGDVGFYTEYGDAEATAKRIEEALRSDRGQEARQRIMTEFPLEKRKKKLVETLNGAIR